MTPTDPQGAEGRETRTEWRNVYAKGEVGYFSFPTRAELEEWNESISRGGRGPVAYQCDILTITRTTTRHTLLIIAVRHEVTARWAARSANEH